jgi:C7-cyclitol 7-kinase
LLGKVDSNEVPDLHGLLSRALGRPVHIMNDISAAAWYLSNKVKEDRFFVVTVSTGIGSKVFDGDHELGVIEDQPFAGEIGHFTVDTSPDAPECDCGGRGHLGAIASGRGFERLAQATAVTNPGAFAKSACAKRFGAKLIPTKTGFRIVLNNEDHLVKAVRCNDPWATAILVRGIRGLAQTLVPVVVSAGITKIILIGGLAQSIGGRYKRMLTEEIQAITQVKGYAPPVKGLVALRDWEEQTCLLGAAGYARRLKK